MLTMRNEHTKKQNCPVCFKLKGVGLSTARSIRGHQLVWHVGVALPENEHIAPETVN